MKIDPIFRSKLIAFTAINDVAVISQPLKEYLNIDYFGFQRDSVNFEKSIQQSLAILCNNFDFMEFAFSYSAEARQKRKLSRDPVIYDLDNKVRYYLLATEFPSYAAAISEHCGLYHWITRAERISENEWDICAFATKSRSPKYLDLYLNNRELLDKFTAYFRDKAAKLIQQTCKEKFISSYPAQCINKNNVQKSFLDAITTNSFYLINNENKQIKVPSAEMQCLLLLAKGRSAKEIANSLNISPRTVETNWNRSKNRLNCYSRKELLDILEKNDK